MEIEELKEKLMWYEDYARVVYGNKPNVDQYACDYADEQQRIRNGIDRWVDCDTCEGEHFIVSNDEDGNEQVQKCDECNIFETDEEAQKHYEDFH